MFWKMFCEKFVDNKFGQILEVDFGAQNKEHQPCVSHVWSQEGLQFQIHRSTPEFVRHWDVLRIMDDSGSNLHHRSPQYVISTFL